MNTAAATLTIRPFALADVAAITAIDNAYNPDMPQSVAARERHEQARDPSLPFTQLVAEQAGQVVGFGWCGRERGLQVPGASRIWVAVAPEHCGQGIGRRLGSELIRWACRMRQSRLISICNERWSRAVRTLEAAGFSEIGRRYDLALALDRFDQRPFAGVFERIAARGITLTTLAQERRPDAAERLYRLAHPLLASIPLPAGVICDLAFHEWCAVELDAPDASPDALVIAKRGETYIGYSSVRLPQHGPAQTVMTGVRADERRQGVALALKLQTIRIALADGYHALHTTNDPANVGILALNKRLGYTALPAWRVWEKRLPDANQLTDHGSSFVS